MTDRTSRSYHDRAMGRVAAGDLTYEHERSEREPLLWIADYAAGAHLRGDPRYTEMLGWLEVSWSWTARKPGVPVVRRDTRLHFRRLVAPAGSRP